MPSDGSTATISIAEAAAHSTNAAVTFPVPQPRSSARSPPAPSTFVSICWIVSTYSGFSRNIAS